MYTQLERFARSQHGLVTRSQALSIGLPRSTWYSVLRSGRLDELLPGVARLPGALRTPLQSILAGVLWRGDGALASHRSAAMVWGAPVDGIDPVDVLVGRVDGRTAVATVRVHHPRDRLDLRPSLWQLVPVTNPLRTLLDLGAVDPGAVPRTLSSFVMAGFVRPAAVDAAIARHSRQGRHGIVALRNALADWQFERRPPDSELEVTMQVLLKRAGLPPATFHATIEGFEVDFHIDGSPVILECDGWESHGRDRDQWERDRWRDALLTEAGYIVVRFSWQAIMRRPEWVAERIRASLRQWAPHLMTG
jgi:very-short-patch-repair endonuclease